ncbi:hypothetical protein TherJR_0399 [Thermincola potens JR]|uniref:Uncharacterized protein n=1 Tax=Thermincola potens (strain JR) TaxID=635013 RepID=D5XAI6_THEPJ|nr:hypothetical protein TherJR_0399 [Thermincola potens JR]
MNFWHGLSVGLVENQRFRKVDLFYRIQDTAGFQFLGLPNKRGIVQNGQNNLQKLNLHAVTGADLFCKSGAKLICKITDSS